MPASMIVSRGEAKAMATKQKASRAITKKELAYLLSRLFTVDVTTMQVRRVVKRPSCAAICGRCDTALARCHSFSLSEPFALAISSLGLHRGSLDRL